MKETTGHKQMLLAMWRFIRKNWSTYLIVSIGLLISYGLFVVPTMMTQHVVNRISEQGLTRENLLTAVMAVLFAGVVTYLADYIWVKRLYTKASDYRLTLRKELFSKLIRMRRPFYEKFRSGDMLTRFTNDVNDYTELLGFGFMSIFTALGTIVFVLPAMLLISWQITILAAIPIISLGVIVYWISTKQEIISEQSRDAVANLSNEVLEVVEGIRVTRAYGKKALGAARFRTKTQALVKKSDELMAYQSAYGRLSLSLLALSTAFVIGVGGYFMSKGQLRLGDVVALQLYTGMLMDPMWVLSDVVLVYQIGKVAFDKINELVETTDDMEPNGDFVAEQLEEIAFENYEFAYSDQTEPALKGITHSLRKGQTLGIVGKTGSGKTTLVRQLLRQYPVGQGRYDLNGHPVEQFNRQSIESKLGYVPQEHILFSKSILENIQLSKPEATRDQILEAIAAAAFSEDVSRLSDGLETLVGEKGVSISGGQKQRLSIARALLKEPELLILDDSLSAVDAKTERLIIENIQTLRQGKTNIIVTHRLSAVGHADWILVLDEGNIIEEGTPEELLALRGWYYEQYVRQQSEEGGESC